MYTSIKYCVIINNNIGCQRANNYASLMVTGCWTIPEPKSPQSTFGIHPRLEVAVMLMGAVVAQCPILERNGHCISGLNYTQPPQDWRDGQNTHNLLFWKKFVDQFGAAFGDPLLLQHTKGSAAVHYVIFLHILTYYCEPEASSLIS